MALRLLLVMILMATPSHASLLERFERAINDGQILWPLTMALGAGFLTSLSPCVYPLIPITLTIMGSKRYQSHLQGFLVALFYVFGMSLVYAVLGAIFASIGLIVGSVMQRPVVVLGIAALFMLMAASLFGLINVMVPEPILTKLSAIHGQGKRSAFLMGMVAGVLAAPCTGPILGFILTLIANQSNVVVGVSLMLVFSFGMGVPFLVLGTFSSAIARLPKSGPWMDSIKNVFGAIILGTSFYYLSIAWSPLLVVLKQMRRYGSLWLIILLLFGMLILVVQFGTSRFVVVIKQSLGALMASVALAALLTFDDDALTLVATSHEGIDWHVIDARVDDKQTFDRLLNEAAHAQRPVLIDFYADWCIACKQLELLTFKDENVVRELKRFMLIRIDATHSSDIITTIEDRFGVTGLPTIMFVDEKGKISTSRILGFVVPEKFVFLLKDL